MGHMSWHSEVRGMESGDGVGGSPEVREDLGVTKVHQVTCSCGWLLFVSLKLETLRRTLICEILEQCVLESIV